MSDTFTTRALRAVLFLLLALIMVRALTFAEVMSDTLEGMRKRDLFSMNGVEAPLLASFYRIPVIDMALSNITAAFAQLQMYPADPGAYWQSLIFLTEYAGVYALLLLEACRGSNKGTFFQFPFFLAFFGQFIPIGIMSPIYLFFAYVVSPPQKYAPQAARAISPIHAAAVLPTVVLAYYVPHFPCYFHESYAVRHWWNWIWQLYPVWGSAIFFVSTKVLAPAVESRRCSSRCTIMPTLGVIAVVNTAIYWYTVYSSEVSLIELYVPKYFVQAPGEPDAVMRVIIQYDYLCCFVAVLLWLVLLIRDLEAAGSMQSSWLVISSSVVVVSGVSGLGSALLLLWAWREDVLATRGVSQLAKSK